MSKTINLEIHIETLEAAEAIELLLTRVTKVQYLSRRMSLKEVEEYSGLSESTIRRYVKQNLLTPLQSVNRGKISFNREEVEKIFMDKPIEDASKRFLKQRKRRRKNFI